MRDAAEVKEDEIKALSDQAVNCSINPILHGNAKTTYEFAKSMSDTIKPMIRGEITDNMRLNYVRALLATSIAANNAINDVIETERDSPEPNVGSLIDEAKTIGTRLLLTIQTLEPNRLADAVADSYLFLNARFDAITACNALCDDVPNMQVTAMSCIYDATHNIPSGLLYSPEYQSLLKKATEKERTRNQVCSVYYDQIADMNQLAGKCNEIIAWMNAIARASDARRASTNRCKLSNSFTQQPKRSGQGGSRKKRKPCKTLKRTKKGKK